MQLLKKQQWWREIFCLLALIIGDVIGSIFEKNPIKSALDIVQL